MEKQQASEKKIVANYAFSFIIYSILIGLIPMGAYIVMSGENPDQLMSSIVLGIVNCAVTWLAVMYAARAMKKKYAIADVNSLVLSSFVYLAMIWLVIMVPLSLFGAMVPDAIPAISSTAQDVGNALSVLSVVIFVVASRKYLKA